ncbi:hypothetical protein Ancab_040408 [Ancistrocladus abbreviatus]
MLAQVEGRTWNQLPNRLNSEKARKEKKWDVGGRSLGLVFSWTRIFSILCNVWLLFVVSGAGLTRNPIFLERHHDKRMRKKYKKEAPNTHKKQKEEEKERTDR